MHKKAGNLLSEWALALRRSIGEPAPLPTQLPGVAAACAPVNTAASSPVPPPNTPALSQKKATSPACKSTGEQTKGQAETAEIADNFAASDAGGNVIQSMEFDGLANRNQCPCHLLRQNMFCP